MAAAITLLALSHHSPLCSSYCQTLCHQCAAKEWQSGEREKTELYSGIEHYSTIIASYMHVFLNRLVRTSMAVLNVCTFTERGSQTSSSLMSAITPLSPSTPHVVLPSAACFAWDEKLGTSKSIVLKNSDHMHVDSSVL